MKVLLIRPPQQAPYYSPSSFPLGLGYVAKAVLKSGYDIEVLDVGAYEYTEKEVIQRIEHMDYDVAGISALSTQYTYVKWLTSELKKRNGGNIVVGGALATHSPEIVLQNTKADICVIGEGEITFPEILANIDKMSNVLGICFKQGDKIIRNLPREYIHNLDSIEFPTWDIFPTDIYIENNRLVGHPNVKCMAVLASRGCPYRCRYCSKSLVRFRFRSVENIVAEIKEVMGKYSSVKGLYFWDELFVNNKRRVYELCDGIEPLNIKWSCQAKVNLVDFELLKRMKRAGCVVVGYGIESGSQSILDRMNKEVTVEQARNALIDTIKAGIRPQIHMMYGYPGETRETLRETIRFFEGLPYLSIGTIRVTDFNPTLALPGAELYEQALKDGLISDEAKYLERLSAGYMFDRIPLNLTKFTVKEFYQLERMTEREIFWGNIKRHPFRFAVDYPSYMFHWVAIGITGAIPYLSRYGFGKTIRLLVKIVLIRR